VLKASQALPTEAKRSLLYPNHP